MKIVEGSKEKKVYSKFLLGKGELIREEGLKERWGFISPGTSSQFY